MSWYEGVKDGEERALCGARPRAQTKLSIGHAKDWAKSPRQNTRLTHLLLALPIVLAHTAQITIPAMIMSIVGGLLIYATIISFTMFFREESEF